MAASNVNVVVITGNLTQDPELRHLGSGTAVCELRVAVNSRRKDQSGNWVDKANYFNVTVWGAQGENCAQYSAPATAVAVATTTVVVASPPRRATCRPTCPTSAAPRQEPGPPPRTTSRSRFLSPYRAPLCGAL